MLVFSFLINDITILNKKSNPSIKGYIMGTTQSSSQVTIFSKKKKKKGKFSSYNDQLDLREK